MLKKVALVGRPNVGKSTLFNRLIGRKHAIISDVPGTTRDRLYHVCEWDDRRFELVDMAGLDFASKDLKPEMRELEEGVKFQAELAISEADLILLLMDARMELLKEDYEIAKFLRSQNKPVILVANKCEDPKHELVLGEWQRLGLGEPVAVSAQNGRKTDDLLDRIIKVLKIKKNSKEDHIEQALRLAIVGRPNVGKSSILNAILGEDKALVSNIAGTTRDTIDTTFNYSDQPFYLIDTAGIRRKSKVGIRNIEHYSVLRSLKAIDRCQIAVWVIDATEPLSKQDQKIAEYILAARKGLVLVVNKWDLFQKDEHTLPQYERYLYRKLNYLTWAPIIFTSAVDKKRLSNILDQALLIQAERTKRIPTTKLNRLLEEFKTKHAPSARNHKYKQPKIYYATQVDVEPPTFTLFVNEKKSLHFSYLRYLENSLRETFGFHGTPIVLNIRNRSQREKK